MRDFVVVIPARLNSGRLGRKPLANICGKPMILHTHARALEVVPNEDIFVATDSKEIMGICLAAGINSIMTSKKCLTGTDRIAEFALEIESKVYINLQGDEPIMPSGNISKMIEAGLKEPNLIINGWASICKKKEYISRTIPKVMIKSNGDLMYMSRSPIPGNKLNKFIEAKKQICVYSFPINALQFFQKNSYKSPVEEIEDIELLRFLEMGWRIKMIELSGSSIAVDTPQDLELVRKKMGHKT